MFLVVIIIIITAISVGTYLTSSVAGKPIEIRTFAEYRWANYLPSAALFYLTYPDESWEALNQIALSSDEWNNRIKTKDEFFTELKDDYDLSKLEFYINNLNEELWNEDRDTHTFFIKYEQGLVISIGLPKTYTVENGFITFPDEYPYNCYTKNTPVYTTSGDTNNRIRFVLCCYDIQVCSDYITGPGRMECKNDVCGISSKGCQEHLCNRIGENDYEECRGHENEWVCIKTRPICGDGVKEGEEECDDGNTESGDGCSSECLLEGCSCSGTGYETRTLNGDTIHVDCDADKCWTPTRDDYNWSDAKKYCRDLGYGRFTDWKLPSNRTLKKLCDLCDGTCFDEGTTSLYWSSTNYNIGKAYAMPFDNCISSSNLKSNDLDIRCVRED